MKRNKLWILTAICITSLLGCGSTNDAPKEEVAANATVNEAKEEAKEDDAIQTEKADEAPGFRDMPVTNEKELKDCLDKAFEEYVEQESKNEKRLEEIEKRAMNYQEATMKYGLQKKGEPDENGYPLYIALHGGGQSDTPDINDQQWNAMATYYGTSVKNGIYINPRGVRDTWNCHFNDESFILYDELIENMILFYNVDPNRVYLMGYSAGGDGVYAIAPRMADRFAAVNMSAGHPNGVSLKNFYNLPIALQVGINDDAYDRNLVTCEYGIKLDELQKEYGENSFLHETWVHLGYAHNFIDYKNSPQPVIDDYVSWYENGTETEKAVDTNAVHFLMNYTRNPLPNRVIWDLSTRASIRDNDCFYWLRADKDITEGEIIAGFDKAQNKITIEKASVAKGTKIEIMLSPDMVDIFKDIIIETPNEEIVYNAKVSMDYIWNTTCERGDRNYQFVDSITIEL